MRIPHCRHLRDAKRRATALRLCLGEFVVHPSHPWFCPSVLAQPVRSRATCRRSPAMRRRKREIDSHWVFLRCRPRTDDGAERRGGRMRGVRRKNFEQRMRSRFWETAARAFERVAAAAATASASAAAAARHAPLRVMCACHQRGTLPAADTARLNALANGGHRKARRSSRPGLFVYGAWVNTVS